MLHALNACFQKSHMQKLTLLTHQDDEHMRQSPEAAQAQHPRRTCSMHASGASSLPGQLKPGAYEHAAAYRVKLTAHL